MVHPDQAIGLPAVGLELRPQRLPDVRELEVDPPVREPGERVVGDGDELVDAHRRVALDAHDVEVVVVRVASGARDRAVRPRLEHVADRVVRGVAPGAGALRHVRHVPTSPAKRA